MLQSFGECLGALSACRAGYPYEILDHVVKQLSFPCAGTLIIDLLAVPPALYEACAPKEPQMMG